MYEEALLQMIMYTWRVLGWLRTGHEASYSNKTKQLRIHDDWDENDEDDNRSHTQQHRQYR